MHIQTRSLDQFCGVQNPQNLDLWTQKVDFLNLTPLTLLQTPHFLPILWLKVNLLADLENALYPCIPWLQACAYL